MHCDTLSRLMHGKGTETGAETLESNHLRVDFKRMRHAGELAQFFACFVKFSEFNDWDNAYRYVLKMTDTAHAEKEESFVENLEQLKINEDKGCPSGILTVEEGGVLNGRPERLDELYNRGIRLVTLTWNYENCIGSPNSSDPELMERGLKPFGIEIIEKMNEKGMIIDVSHLSDGGFRDCIRYSRKPVVASHSNVRELCPHPRNLTEEMLRALGNSGGVAGVNFYSKFLCGDRRAGVEDIVRHVVRMINAAGTEGVALGTDFDGFIQEALPLDILGVQDMEYVFDALKKNGISEEQLEKIAYGNVLRVIHDNWK